MQVSGTHRGLTALVTAGLVASVALATTAAPAAAAGKVTCGGQVATIVGTNGPDVIYGTKRADVIAGLGGNDVIIGRGGNDIICGGPGADRLVGGDGSDRLYGNAGPDRLFGGNGPDRLYGGVGDDVLAGQTGNDLLYGMPGTDRCYQGQGTGKEVGCEPFLLPLKGILAVAYSDIDGLDGYSTGDVLIAKLVDTNGDKVPSIGDTVRMGRYPLDFSATAFGDWRVKSHLVTGQVIADAVSVVVTTGAESYHWDALPAAAIYSEFSLGGFSAFQDGYGSPYPEQLAVDAGSGSQPNTTVLNMIETRYGDQRFLDVELHY